VFSGCGRFPLQVLESPDLTTISDGFAAPGMTGRRFQ
jgi:hypothetical protein